MGGRAGEAGGLVGVVEETFQPDRGERPVAGETGVGGDRAETWPSGGDIESGDELWDGTPRDDVVLFQAVAECIPVGGGKSLLDAGTGSGILAISAAKLGYDPVEAWDFDPVAVDVARRNAEQNGLGQVLAFKERDLTKMSPGGRQFDVVCANLMSELLVAEKAKLASWLAPAGRLVLAGILEEQFTEVEAAFCGLGMELIAAESLDEWRSGTFQFSC